jgi:acyl-coenzyme A synthetase/AMP-(fatty) acid ligase
MNFARDVVDAADPGRRALVALDRDGGRREWCFGEVAERSGALAGALARRGVEQGDVVLTLVGNRPEWVFAMVACFRIGAVVLPCTEQLRAHDLRLRLHIAQPRAIVCDERNRAELDAAGPDCPVLTIPDEALYAEAPAPPPAELGDEEPSLLTFTSGT